MLEFNIELSVKMEIDSLIEWLEILLLPVELLLLLLEVVCSKARLLCICMPAEDTQITQHNYPYLPIIGPGHE